MAWRRAPVVAGLKPDRWSGAGTFAQPGGLRVAGHGDGRDGLVCDAVQHGAFSGCCSKTRFGAKRIVLHLLAQSWSGGGDFLWARSMQSDHRALLLTAEGRSGHVRDGPGASDLRVILGAIWFSTKADAVQADHQGLRRQFASSRDSGSAGGMGRLESVGAGGADPDVG